MPSDEDESPSQPEEEIDEDSDEEPDHVVPGGSPIEGPWGSRRPPSRPRRDTRRPPKGPSFP